MNEKCDMIILEDGDLNYWWECSVCKKKFKDTNKFMKSKICKNCGSEIKNWIGMDDEYEA